MSHPLHIKAEAPAGLVYAAPGMVWSAAMGQGCTYFNEQRLAFTGRALDEELGFGWLDAVHPEEREHCRAVYERALEAQESFQVAYRLRRHDGRFRWVLDAGVPQFDSDGAFTGFAGTTTDVHERRLPEEQLGALADQSALEQDAAEAPHGNEINWRTLVERNPDPIIISAQGRILYVNQAGVKLLGAHAKSEIIGKSIFEFAPPSLHHIGQERLERIERRREATTPIESVLHRLDGTERYVETFSTPTVYQGKQAAQTVLRDVTERRMGSEALRQSEERFSKAFQGAPVAMVITRLGSGRVVDANESFARMTGYARQEVVGRKAAAIGLSVHRVLRDHVADILEEGVTYRDVEVQILAKSGAVRDVLSSGEFIEIGGESCLLSMFYDITERKRLEREVLEIAEAERRRIGQDLHDGLGQQLTGIAFLSRILERNIEAASPAHADQMRRIVDLIAQAISYTRNLSRMLSPVDISADGLPEALHRLAQSTSEFSEVQCQLDGGDEICVSNNTAATHLYRITQEAITNALKHASPQKIVIELVAQEGHGVLRVRDDGKGLPVNVDKNASGMGMRTMLYRSNVIGGALAIRPDREGGTIVECRFPLGQVELSVDSGGGINPSGSPAGY
ncbi:MAG TPA: PAS domain S-box protein [Rhodothermales bacterium]|nr:PAS domain S-box protein [Rhodothermales bacterium]